MRSSISTSSDKWNHPGTQLKKALCYSERREASGCSVCPGGEINVTVHFVLGFLMPFWVSTACVCVACVPPTVG